MYVESYRNRQADITKCDELLPLYMACEVTWRTLSEQTIISSSSTIRSTPGWEKKLANEADREQWIADMKGNGLTDKQASYVISELFYYAKLQEFIRSSGSNAKLSDEKWVPIELIVDPSLYSLVYKSTPILPEPMTSPLEALSLSSFGTVPGSIDAWKQAVCDLNASMASKGKGSAESSEQSDTAANSFVPFNEVYLGMVDEEERHWLPTDIYVNGDGSVDFKSYINNVHPVEHAGVYTAISKILARTIPLLEQVLTDWKHPRDLRVPYDYWNCLVFPEKAPEYTSSDEEDDDYDEKWGANYNEWRDSIVDTTENPADFVEPKRPLAAYSLRNKNLQVVVEITDKGMTPFSTTAAENIIATAIYCYDVGSEGKGNIGFDEGIECDSTTIFGSGYDMLAHEILYGGEQCTKGYFIKQSAGSIDIEGGRIICYPNVYRIYDTTGRPKRLTMYFVDPSIRVVSTAIVPPQQKDWWTKAVSSVPSRLSMLPMEIQNMVFKNVDSPMSFEQASDIVERPNGAEFCDDFDEDDYD
ncbi:hypothetical protein LPJ56_003108, partial [Coemansia sp. RSA 2599]